MKWIRSKYHIQEYSTLSIGARHYISMVRKPDTRLYLWSYSKNCEQILYRSFYADSWDEAEQLVIKKIKEELSWKAEHWNKMLNDFDKEVSANEAVDE